MASASFLSLSSEILLQILSSFCLHCNPLNQDLAAPDSCFYDTPGEPQRFDEPSWYSLNRHALFSSCLVSKELRDLAQPILYHEFMPGFGDSWRSKLYSWDHRLSSFLATVTERRDLARLVKRIYIHPYLLRERPVIPSKLLPSPLLEVLDTLLPGLEHFGIQGPGMRWQHVKLPIQTLDVSVRDWAPRFRSGFVLYENMPGLVDMAPKLETLTLHMCNRTWRRPPYPSFPNLRTLRVTKSTLNEEHVGKLLSSCTKLRTFVYEDAGTNADNPSGYGQRMPFHLANIFQYLDCHHETLTSLHLDLRALKNCNLAQFLNYDPHNEIARSNSAPKHVSLKGFSKLQYLFVNSDDIYDLFDRPAQKNNRRLVDFLPPAIVSLRVAAPSLGWVERPSATAISRANRALAEGLIYLGEHAAAQLPGLKDVACDVDFEVELEKHGVTDAFGLGKLGFDYQLWPHSKYTAELIDFYEAVPSSPLGYTVCSKMFENGGSSV